MVHILHIHDSGNVNKYINMKIIFMYIYRKRCALQALSYQYMAHCICQNYEKQAKANIRDLIFNKAHI